MMTKTVSAQALALLLWIGACAGDPVTDVGSEFANVRNGALDQEHLDRLARDYLYKQVDGRESREISEQIRRLNAQQSRYLHDQIGKLNNYQGTDKLFFDLMFEEAVRQNKSFLDVGQAEMQATLKLMRDRRSFESADGG